MIFSRCESLILEQGLEDALKRCKAYLKAGSDGIMIHSRKSDGAEILDFCKDKLSGYKRPEKIIIVDQLPRKSMGKILKKDLRKNFKNK